MISSLDQNVDQDVELAWQEEIGSRLREIDSGVAECIPWEDVRGHPWTSGTGIDILIDKIKIACYLLLHAKKSQN